MTTQQQRDIARHALNRLRHSTGALPSTKDLTAAIAKAMARTNPRPSEHAPASAEQLARDVVAELPLVERCAVAIADREHPGKLRALARQCALGRQHVGAGEREQLDQAQAALEQAACNQ
jgi:hypothetical protein